MASQFIHSPPGTWNAWNLLTVPEVAEWARVHPKTVYRWIKEGKFEAIQFGPRTFRVPEVAIGKFLHKPGRGRMTDGTDHFQGLPGTVLCCARSLACQRNDPFLKCFGHGRGPVIHAQLAVYMNEVGFDRCRADVQTFADFSVACSFGHQMQHFNLAGA